MEKLCVYGEGGEAMLDYVMRKLSQRNRNWAEVSRVTGVPYPTLQKIASSHIHDPGIRKVQLLADYFLTQDKARQLFRERMEAAADYKSNLLKSQIQ